MGKVYSLKEILAYSKESDLAIFRVDNRGEKLAHLSLGDAAQVGARVCAITHPNMFCYYYSEGVVARNVSEGSDQSRRMEITADYARGSSGGPIFNSFGQVTSESD
ncbi:hypothetical protein BWD42_07475 [Sphingobacterium sp. CZ-UAM]|nr:hypothetical protein BWD42_07475 [Sphingobacterium sp. CZ-UAM]